MAAIGKRRLRRAAETNSIINEADRMSLPAEVMRLDGIENLPARVVVVFTRTTSTK